MIIFGDQNPNKNGEVSPFFDEGYSPPYRIGRTGAFGIVSRAAAAFDGCGASGGVDCLDTVPRTKNRNVAPCPTKALINGVRCCFSRRTNHIDYPHLSDHLEISIHNINVQVFRKTLTHQFTQFARYKEPKARSTKNFQKQIRQQNLLAYKEHKSDLHESSKIALTSVRLDAGKSDILYTHATLSKPLEE